MPQSKPAGSNISIIDLTWCEEDGRSHKRKRTDRLKEEEQEEMDADSKLQTKLLQLIKQLDKEARKLDKTMADNPNTKREIKEISLAIRSLTSQATTKHIWSMVSTRHQRRSKGPELVAMTETEDAGCQVDTTETMFAEHLQRMWDASEDVGVQTEEFEFWTPEGKVRKIEQEQIREIKTYEDFARIRNFDWTEKLYTVERQECSPLQAVREYELVVWDEGEKRGEQTKRIMDKYKELKEITGKATHLHITTKRIDHEGNKLETEKVLTKVETDFDSCHVLSYYPGYPTLYL